jgi:hypothetical protein
MNRLNRTFEMIKQWFLHVVTTRFYYEKDKQSVNWEFWMYKIKRREPVQDEAKRGKLHDVSIISYRRSKLKGYEYLTISFFHYIRISVDLHRPL